VIYASRNQECSLRGALLLYPPLLRRGWMLDLVRVSAGSPSVGGILVPRHRIPWKPNMDGGEGEGHVHLGAKIMGLLFGSHWADFTLRHSRYWAKKHGVTVSKLCYADKLAFVLTPAWLYLPMARATGELTEYMAKSLDRQAGCAAFSESERAHLESGKSDLWLKGLQAYTRRWVEQHRNGNADTWTVVRGGSAEGSWIGTE
jgi:hypothetical protein